MYAEDDLVLISALQHIAFCPRQCALIHIEGAWAENLLTAQGRVMHEKAHDAGVEYVGSTRIVRGLRLRSLRLGITGVADVVEFRRSDAGVPLPSAEGCWLPFPVEYKRGKPKIEDCDRVQLCAQALCIEEMLSVNIPEGAIFYGQPRRRQVIQFNASLREATEATARDLRKLIESGVTPRAVFEKKCNACSLLEICRPETVGAGKSVAKYLGQMLSGDKADE